MPMIRQVEATDYCNISFVSLAQVIAKIGTANVFYNIGAFFYFSHSSEDFDLAIEKSSLRNACNKSGIAFLFELTNNAKQSKPDIRGHRCCWKLTLSSMSANSKIHQLLLPWKFWLEGGQERLQGGLQEGLEGKLQGGFKGASPFKPSSNL